MSTEEILLVLAIFSLRVLNNAMGTLRVIVMTQGQRTLPFILAFLESIIFAYTAGKVLTDLEDMPNLLAYAGGFAVGNSVGMAIEQRFIKGYITVTVVLTQGAKEVANTLREAGFGVTEMLGEGGQGQVHMLRSVVERHDVRRVSAIVHKLEPDAFITTESASSIQRGWLREMRQRGHRK